MPGIGTRGAADQGQRRPLFTFGHAGDETGTPLNDGFAERALLITLAAIVETSVGDLDVDFHFCDVIRFNQPDTGNHSLRSARCCRNEIRRQAGYIRGQS